MKTRMKLLAVFLMVLSVLLIGCAAALGSAPQTAQPVPTPENGTPAVISTPEPEKTPAELDIPKSIAPDLPNTRTVTVKTADEFLEALDSNVSIRIDSELLDFSTASGYGENFGEHYRWVKEFDGPTLEIHDVENLQIIGNGKDKTTLQAVPRYADVLRFIDCKNLVLADFTAGHLKEAPGSCSGMVLTFRNCSNVSMQRCGLFGCGVNGIVGERSSHFSITDTEIYECSQLGAVLGECSDIVFEDCRVRDCGMNSISVNGTNGDLLYNGTTLKDGDNFVG